MTQQVRVQNSFNARLFVIVRGLFNLVINISRRSCDSRKYTYFFPTYLLIPPKPGSGLDRTLQDNSPTPNTRSVSLHPFWSSNAAATSSREEDLIRKRQWRISSEEMMLLRATATRFEGTVSLLILSSFT